MGSATPAGRLGAVYPNDMWVDEDVQSLLADFRYFLPDGVGMVSAGTPCPVGEGNAEYGRGLAENGDIDEAARRLMRYSPDCIAYFCTTVSFIRGIGADEAISERITRATGLPATTTSTAMVKALRSLGVKRLSLASPYMPDVEAAFAGFLEAHGFEVVNSVALNLPGGHSTVDPERMRQAAEAADRPEAEALFVGCTGQRLGSLLDDMERRLGKPVLTANQVTAWHALHLLGHEPAMERRGSLFSRRGLAAPSR